MYYHQSLDSYCCCLCCLCCLCYLYRLPTPSTFNKLNHCISLKSATARFTNPELHLHLHILLFADVNAVSTALNESVVYNFLSNASASLITAANSSLFTVTSPGIASPVCEVVLVDVNVSDIISRTQMLTS